VRLLVDSSSFAKRYIQEPGSEGLDLEWKADLFVTSDKRQFDSAVKSGLQAEYLGQLYS
jgi:predicted nucleic acid-binding protein